MKLNILFPDSQFGPWTQGRLQWSLKHKLIWTHLQVSLGLYLNS